MWNASLEKKKESLLFAHPRVPGALLSTLVLWTSFSARAHACGHAPGTKEHVEESQGIGSSNPDVASVSSVTLPSTGERCEFYSRMTRLSDAAGCGNTPVALISSCKRQITLSCIVIVPVECEKISSPPW